MNKYVRKNYKYWNNFPSLWHYCRSFPILKYPGIHVTLVSHPTQLSTMKLFKYFSNVLCSHYGWRIINLEWLECLLPWAMSGEGTLSAVRLSELQEINQFSSPCEFLLSRVLFAERRVWHFFISFPSFRMFSFLSWVLNPFSEIFLMRMCVFLMWETIVVDMGTRRKMENLIFPKKWDEWKLESWAFNYLCSTRQHEIEGKNAVVIQLFIAAGLMIGKEMSFQDENGDDIHTAACLHAYLVYLRVGYWDKSSTSLDSRLIAMLWCMNSREK